MAISLTSNYIATYKSFVEDGWKDGFKINWTEKADWFGPNGVYPSTVLSANSEYIDNTALVIRSTEVRYPQCGFKFLYKISGDSILWTLVFIDFGIVSSKIQHMNNNNYSFTVTYNGLSYPKTGNGQIQPMQFGIPGNCQVMYYGTIGNAIGSQDVSGSFAYFNWYWTNYDRALSCGSNFSSAASSVNSPSFNYPTSISTNLLPSYMIVGELDNGTASYGQYVTLDTDANYINSNQATTGWRVVPETLLVDQAVGYPTRMHLFYSYWNDSTVCRETVFAVQVAPKNVNMGWNYDSGTLTMNFIAHQNKGSNGYFNALKIGSITITDKDFITQSQTIVLTKDGSDNWLYNGQQTGLSGSQFTITCRAILGGAVYNGTEFNFDISLDNQIKSVTADCSSYKNYYDESGNVNHQTSACFTVVLQDALPEDGDELTLVAKYRMASSGNDLSVGFSNNREHLPIFVDTIQEYATTEDGVVYKIRLDDLDPRQTIQFYLMGEGGSQIGETKYIDLVYSEKEDIQEISDGTLVNADYIGSICDFTNNFVCGNFSNFSNQALAQSITNLKKYAIKDNLVTYDNYIDVIQRLKALYDLLVGMDYYYCFRYVSGQMQLYATPGCTPLQNPNVTIVVTNVNSTVRVSSSDIFEIVNNDYEVQNQEVEPVTETKNAWVVQIIDDLIGQLIIADQVDDTQSTLSVQNNFQNAIIYIAKNLF